MLTSGFKGTYKAERKKNQGEKKERTRDNITSQGKMIYKISCE